MPPPWGKARSQLPGPGLGNRQPLFSAPGNCKGRRMAGRGSRHTQDHPGLPFGGEVRHARWWRVHAQTGLERNGYAEGQPHLGIRKYHRGGELHILCAVKWLK